MTWPRILRLTGCLHQGWVKMCPVQAPPREAKVLRSSPDLGGLDHSWTLSTLYLPMLSPWWPLTFRSWLPKQWASYSRHIYIAVCCSTAWFHYVPLTFNVQVPININRWGALQSLNFPTEVWATLCSGKEHREANCICHSCRQHELKPFMFLENYQPPLAWHQLYASGSSQNKCQASHHLFPEHFCSSLIII